MPPPVARPTGCERSPIHSGAASGVGGAARTRLLKTFRNAVMMTAFVKSMKKAPTIGTTR